jgi:hypothetical protein
MAMSQDLQNQTIKDAKTIREDLVKTLVVAGTSKAETSTCGPRH